MKKYLFIALFFSFIFESNAQLGSTPGCDDLLNVCLVHNSNQDLKGVQIGTQFFLNENCISPTLTTSTRCVTSSSIYSNETNLPLCNYFAQGGGSGNELALVINQLHWSGKMTLEYFNTNYPTNNLPVNSFSRNLEFYVPTGGCQPNSIDFEDDNFFRFTRSHISSNDITAYSGSNSFISPMFISPNYTYLETSTGIIHHFNDDTNPNNIPVSLDYIG